MRIARAVRDVVERMQPQAVAIEELFFGANAKAALAVGQARGVCILACAEAGIPVFEYTNSAIKQAVTGYGRADKQQVMEMVRVQLRMTEVAAPRPRRGRAGRRDHARRLDAAGSLGRTRAPARAEVEHVSATGTGHQVRRPSHQERSPSATSDPRVRLPA